MTIDYSTLCNTDISKIRELHDTLDSWLATWRDSTFIEVTVLNYEGNITKQLEEKFPKFKIWWRCDNPGTIGENIILIHKQDWNEEVKAEISKFDSFVGHHVEKHTEYVIREDIDLPFEIKQLLEHRRSIAAGRGKKLEKVGIKAWEFNNDSRLLHYWSERDKWFIETEVIDREWDEKLWVRDCTESSSFARFKNLKIEFPS